MQLLIFSLLGIVIGLGGLWYHDVRHPPEAQSIERKRKQSLLKGGTPEESKPPVVGAYVAEHVAALPVKTELGGGV